MWVRSQDKKRLLNCNGFAIHTEKTVEVNLYGYIADETWDKTWYLGTYSSEEKALKVLDIIQARIDLILKNELTVQGLLRSEKITIYDSLIFQIPLDSEVIEE